MDPTQKALLESVIEQLANVSGQMERSAAAQIEAAAATLIASGNEAQAAALRGRAGDLDEALRRGRAAAEETGTQISNA